MGSLREKGVALQQLMEVKTKGTRQMGRPIFLATIRLMIFPLGRKLGKPGPGGESRE
jgi:hypothetical protein